MVTTGLLLAGGRSRRMGGANKLLCKVSDMRLLDRAITRLRPQVALLVISANGNAGDVTDPGLPVVEDGRFAGRGPLAGILAGMRWSQAVGDSDALVVSSPADTPFLPLDLVRRLTAERGAANTDTAVAASGGRVHHAIAAWPAALADDLEAWLASGRSSAIRDFLASRTSVTVTFAAAYDPFFNINTPDDLQRAVAIEETFAP
jgi:molybdenum cofactor guanylyltransferase